MSDFRAPELGGAARSLRIAVLAHSQADELGAGLCEAFAANGCYAEILTATDRWPGRSDLYVMYGPMAPIGPLLTRLRSLPQRPSVAVWYTEPLPPQQPMGVLSAFIAARGIAESLLRRWGHLLGAQRAGRLGAAAGRLRACAEMRLLHRWDMLELLAVFTERHAQVFGAWGLPVEIIPMGACAGFGHLMNLERDIDVAFIGSTHDRRRGPIVAELTRQLAAAGLNVVVKDGSPGRGYVFGRERAELLNRTKILLSIMRQPWDDPIFRLLLAAPNGVLVLSEPVRASSPFVPGRHFAVARLEEMLPAVQHYLRADEERQQIASAAYRLVSQELTMTAMAQRFLQAWRSRTTAGKPTITPPARGDAR